MPLPLIIIGAAAASALTGVAFGTKGVSKIKKAKAIIKENEKIYNKELKEHRKIENKVNNDLLTLGSYKVNIWKDFEKFVKLFEKIKNKPRILGTPSKGESLKLDVQELKKIAELISLGQTVIDTTGAAAAGLLTGVAAYGGTMMIATASTGTAISTLSGAAAYNATLAALGGGSIASGGGGMALGSTVLGSAVAGPAILVGGILLSREGNKALKEAKKYKASVEKTVRELRNAIAFNNRYGQAICIMSKALRKWYLLYLKEIDALKNITNRYTDYNKFTSKEKSVIENCIILIQILKKLSTIDLLVKDKVGNTAINTEFEKAIHDCSETKLHK